MLQVLYILCFFYSRQKLTILRCNNNYQRKRRLNSMRSILKGENGAKRNNFAKSIGNRQDIRVSFDETLNKLCQYVHQKTHQTSYAQDNKETYQCGCGLKTNSMKGFSDHVKVHHGGHYIENSSHYISEFTKMVLPCSGFQDTSEKKTKLRTKNEFKPETLRWTNFVLVYNKNFKYKWFLCGKCEKNFHKTIDYVNHCIGTCQELENPSSSHFIYDQEDWNQQQRQRQKVKNKFKPLQIQKPFLNYKKKNYLEVLYNNRSLIEAFTRDIIQRWKQKKIDIDLCFMRKYRIFNDFVLIVNFQSNAAKMDLSKNSCKSCGFSTQYLATYFYHLKEQCLTFHDNSQIFVLSKKIFYQLFKQKLLNDINQRQIKAVDSSFIFYLYQNHQEEKLKTTIKRSQYMSLRLFLKLLNYDNIMSLQKCLKCKSKINSYNQLVAQSFKSIYQHITNSPMCASQCIQLQIQHKFNRRIKSEYYKPNQSRIIMLFKQFQSLKSQSFYCHQCQNAKKMSLCGYIDHVNEKHNGRAKVIINLKDHYL